MTKSLHGRGSRDRWMAEQHQNFVAGLAERLDIEAGLREVLLDEQHTDFVEKVRGEIDIEAGLTAILPAELPTDLMYPDPEDEDEDAGSLQWASDALALMPLSTRLVLRAQYAAKLGAAARFALTVGQNDLLDEGHLREVREYLEPIFNRQNVDFDWISSRRFAQMYVQALLAPIQEQIHKHGKAPGGREAQDEAVDSYLAEVKRIFQQAEESDRSALFDGLVEVVEKSWPIEPSCTVETTGPNQWASVAWKFLLRILDHADEAVTMARYAGRDFETLSRSMVHGKVSIALAELMSHLGYLEQMLNDFTRADLRDVDLAGVPLDGVRWSEVTTRWPDRWIEQIERDSVPIGDGVFEIHYGTTTHTDMRV